MAKAGRYRRKRNTKKIIGIALLLLIFLAGLFFYYTTRDRNNGADAELTAQKTTEQNQISQPTTAAEESTDDSSPTKPTTATVETTETAAETEPVQESQSENRWNPENTEEGYAAVLQQYRELIMMDSSEFFKLYGNESELELQLSIEALEELADNGDLAMVAEILGRPTLRDRYPFVDGGTLRDAKTYSDDDSFDPTVYQYAYYNIDGKSNSELLIGVYNEYSNDYTILAIYTPKMYTASDMAMKSVVDNSRAHLTIYTDGTVGLDYSGGAAHHYWDYYRIDAEHLPDLFEPIASFYINYDASRAEYMADAVGAYAQMLTPVSDIPWQQLIEE